MTFVARAAMEPARLLHEMQWQRLGERPLFESPSPPKHVYRLMWTPSFHPYAVVRIEGDEPPYRLAARRGPDAARRESDHLPRETTFVLSKTEHHVFEALLATSDFWELPTIPTPEVTGLDGTRWLLEAFVDGRYHLVDRWMPKRSGREAGFRALVDWMLAESGVVAESRVGR